MRDWLNKGLPLGWEWGQPWALLALALPLLVLLASMRPSVPEPRYTGAFALWRHVRTSSAGERRRLQVPFARWCWIFSLILGALALAQPRNALPNAPRRLAVVMDTSPSMELPHPEGGTRKQAALRTFFRWLDKQGPVALEYLDGRVIKDRDALAAKTHRSASITDWNVMDHEGVVWITDHVPDERPKLAGCVASGGDAVFGAIAARGAERWWWNGQELEWRTLEGARGSLQLTGRIPFALRDFALSWAQERGWQVVEGQGRSSGPSLSIVAESGLPANWRRVGRDGWTAWARPLAGERDLPSSAEPWLEDLVYTAPGKIILHLGELSEAEQYPAAFVASWADLFDAQVALPEDVMDLDERAAAGQAVFLAPRLVANQRHAAGEQRADRLAAWLGLWATVLGLMALGLSNLAQEL